MKNYLILRGNEVPLEGVPGIITVLPLGYVVSSKGDFCVDEESFRAMKAQIAQRGVDLVVDYEHQTLKGCEAPAAGWVKELKLEDGRITAKVEWTPRGAEYLKNREYRYLSPVVNVRKSDRKAVGLHSLALTNTPAIKGMTPIVNSESFEGGQDTMDMQKLARLLGLDAEATEEQIEQALSAVMAENKSLKEGQRSTDEKVVANKAVCELLDLKAGAPVEDVISEIMKLKGGVINGVNVLEELKVLKAENAKRAAEEAVTLALTSGKITPAQKEWAMSYATDSPEGFASFLAKAPQIVPMGELGIETKPLKAGSDLDDATQLVCRQLGVSKEDVEKYGKET